ncbi:hypothetical protein L9G15_27590, partial [Shewanella sp. A3A]|nr:hypothetical protein [Shewanella ferrihydritica]
RMAVNIFRNIRLLSNTAKLSRAFPQTLISQLRFQRSTSSEANTQPKEEKRPTVRKTPSFIDREKLSEFGTYVAECL